MADASEPRIVGGLFEAFHAVPDLVAALRYWEAFGYRIGADGRLDAGDARRLYGVNMGLRSVRLQHRDADHGLVRLMAWDGIPGPGLGVGPMRGLGARWTGQKTLNMTRINDHAEALRTLGEDTWMVPPFFAPFTPKDKLAPFAEPLPGYREMVMVRALTRQVFIEFVGWELPLYGAVDPECLMQTSQFTHQCLMVQDDSRKSLAFYDEVLGMTRADERSVAYRPGAGANTIFDLAEGETFHGADFDDPRSDNAPAKRRSGRLKIIRVEEGRPLEDLRDLARPGHLGLTGYSFRVHDAAAMRERVKGAGATGVTEVVADEFGRQAFSFDAPDGNFWTAVAA